MVGAVMATFAPRRHAQTQAPLLAAQTYHAAKDAIKARSATIPEPVVPGTGLRWTGSTVDHALSYEQQELVSSREARGGRAFARTGPTPRNLASYPEITLDHIAKVHTHVERNGWMWDKADLDARILREHEHLHPAERARRAWIFQNYPTLVACNDSQLALLVRNAVAAVVDQIDGFDSSVCDMQVANMSGGAVSELIWKPRMLRVVTGPRRSIMVPSDTVASVERISLRSVAYDITTDRPWVNQGNWGWVNPLVNPWTGEDLQKVLVHKGYGDGDTRMCGYGFACHHLHWMSKLAWEKAGTLVEVYGVSTPYLQPVDDENIRDEDYEDAEQALADLGKGNPAIFPARMGEVKLTPTPSALTPLQQAMIGFCYTGMSKLVSGQTLTMEVGNVGSYAAMDGHGDEKEMVQRIDSRLTDGTLNAQMLRYIVAANAQVWAAVFAPYCPGEACSPEAVLQSVPRINWDVSRKVSKADRLKMFIDAKKEGLLIDAGQVYDECGFRPSLSPESAFGAAPSAATSAPPSVPALPAADQEETLEPDQEPTASEAERLAAEMTAHSVERCPHDKPNRCRICGIEKTRAVVPGADGMPHGWSFGWKAIGVSATPQTGAQSNPDPTAEVSLP